MNIRLNGKPAETSAPDLMALWREETEELELESPKGFAISRNGKVVRKTEWDTTPVQDNDDIEIVRAMQGG